MTAEQIVHGVNSLFMLNADQVDEVVMGSQPEICKIIAAVLRIGKKHRQIALLYIATWEDADEDEKFRMANTFLEFLDREKAAIDLETMTEIPPRFES